MRFVVVNLVTWELSLVGGVGVILGLVGLGGVTFTRRCFASEGPHLSSKWACLPLLLIHWHWLFTFSLKIKFIYLYIIFFKRKKRMKKKKGMNSNLVYKTKFENGRSYSHETHSS